MYALVNGKIYTGYHILDDHALIISDGYIKEICPTAHLPININTHNLLGLIVSPGFIDLQLNGCGGVQFNDNSQSISSQTLEIMKITNRRFGCTSFLPTLITSNDSLMKQAIKVVRIFSNQNKSQVLGLHLEGPFLNAKKKGIHNSNLIRSPTKKILDYLCSNSDIIKKITLAPEQLDCVVIEKLQRSGICISIGHSNATYYETKLSFLSGVSFGTHLFNAMPPIYAREPGVIGAIFDTTQIYCSIIADGIHVHWNNIKYAKQIKKDHLILVTDGTSPSGAEYITNFIFSGETILHHKNICTNSHGVLSGSSLTMIQAIQNSVKYANIPLDEALRMATLYPARAIGIDNYLGSLEKNKIANLTVFDKKYQIKKTVVDGKIYVISN
ncbi:N-acetylglucosamine-6-phosphate deacetylase [Candidatus Blochmanniella vafra str. BVAF]|uniref:N-acetylglucosamine-6-phosphate deacetylase n=1 Tax=Blochmanniella vafra (strain BVAF) TaxID=859654 RepID=E8Q6X2_BLOVB|nr:N-acetylglucosamine-6-phosphate deacetylase [Candidatus Blochmannia vafer]ADV33719.1 N-acetylglucosamine-6-phosphate deacetylase [Candidatus Blochmannia vafer str. BVAF]